MVLLLQLGLGFVGVTGDFLLAFTFAICHRPSVCRLSVCLSSVTFVHPTQVIEIFSNVSTPFGTLATFDIQVKLGELNTRTVAEYIDFRPIECYISEMVQDRS